MKQLFFILAFMTFVIYGQAQDERFDHPVIQWDGTEASFSEIASNGKNKVVLFWASYCGACKYELKALEETVGDWEEKYGAELVMVSVDRPNVRKDAAMLVKDKGWDSYTNVFDKTNLLFSGFKAYGLPLTLTVDGNGEVTGYWKGYLPNLMQQIDMKLKKMDKKKRKNS
ncbi:MAG: redoxin domain-containing protein [Saprospiraceae bacterium]|nr:redoxin domain-containing protein [Saprospiraceae bacterium]